VRDSRQGIIRALTWLLIVAVLFLLASAFRRVLLYEAAYGFTTARLYAQVFMVVVASALAALAIEIGRGLDPGRLFRRIAAVAVILLVGLIYWNHEAWIANRNIDRYASTGKLDVAYLTKDLSPDAIPAIISRMPSIDAAARLQVQSGFEQRYSKRRHDRELRWFEWNLRRARARAALHGIGIETHVLP
jgi:hypothetical protein